MSGVVRLDISVSEDGIQDITYSTLMTLQLFAADHLWLSQLSQPATSLLHAGNCYYAFQAFCHHD